MYTPDSEPMSAAASVRITRVIWMALLVSVLIYGVVIWFVSQEWSATSGSEEILGHPVLLPLAIAAIATLAMSFFIPTIMLRQGSPSRTPMSPISELAVPDRVRTAFIIQWALLEAVAIYGLVASFLIQDLRPFLVFAGVAIVGLLLAFPSEGRIRGASGG